MLGGQAGVFDKEPPEGIDILVADLPGDFIDGVFRPLQKSFGVFDSQPLKIGEGRFAGGMFKPALEMARTQIGRAHV